MGSYVYVIICVGIITYFLISLSPSGDGGKYKKYIGLIAGLTMAVVIASPITDIVIKGDIDLGSVGDFAKSHDNTEATGSYYASSVGRALSEIYGTDMSDIKASVVFDDNGEISRVCLFTCDGSIYDKEEAGAVLSEIYGMNVEVRNEEDRK